MNRRRLLTAAVVLLTAGMQLTLVPAAGADWQDPECEEDGNPIIDTDFCTPPDDQPQPPADPDNCEGAEYCDLTYAELDAAGFSSSDMDYEDDEASAQVAADAAGTSGVFYGGWVSFYNYDDRKCAGTVRDHNHCAWQFHKYRIYVDRIPRPQTYVTVFPARSGNNDPADKWVVNVGPIPDRFKKKPNADTRRDYRWGRMNGKFTGYEVDSGDSYHPGKWRLDPWKIYKPSDTSIWRGAFEIHGGRNADGTAKLWTTRTQGCIRLSIKGIRGLKGKWNHRTDNKHTARAYVEHNA